MFRLIIAILISTTCFAQQKPDLEIIKQAFSKVIYKKLSNGVRVIIYPRHDAPIFSGWLTVNVGGVDEIPGSTGISHMFEHMAFKGTKVIGTKDYSREKRLLDELEVLMLAEKKSKIPAPQDKLDKIYSELKEIWIPHQFDNEYRRRGAVEVNASTGKEVTNYFSSMPIAALDFWCWMESERIAGPVMRQFYEERDVVMEERRMRFEDDPSGKLYEESLGTAFQQHPYRNPVIGYASDIQQLTATETAAFHDKYYVGSNIVLALVGDLSEADLETVEKYFSKIPAGEAPLKDFGVEREQAGERQVVLKLPSASQLTLGYHKPSYPHKDDPPISVMLDILAGSSISPMYKELVQKKQLAAAVEYYEEPGVYHPNLFVFSAIPKSPHTWQAVRDGIDEVLENFKSTEVTSEQLEIAKRSIFVAYLSRLDSNLELASELSNQEAIFGDYRTMLKWIEEVNQVTPADISRVSKLYLNNDRRTVAAVETVQ